MEHGEEGRGGGGGGESRRAEGDGVDGKGDMARSSLAADLGSCPRPRELSLLKPNEPPAVPKQQQEPCCGPGRP